MTNAKKLVGIITIALLPLVSLSGAEADHSGGLLHWPSGSRNITIEDRTGDPEVQEGIKQGVALMNQNKGNVDLTFAWRIGTPDNTCNVATGTTWRFCFLPDGIEYGGDYGGNYTIPHMTDGWMRMNRKYADSPAGANFIVHHEGGHILGLVHSCERSVMNTQCAPSLQTSTFSDHDRAALAQLYGHCDGVCPTTTTTKATTTTTTTTTPGPIIQGNTWHSTGETSLSGPSGTTITAYATSARTNTEYRLVSARNGCKDDVQTLNPNVRTSSSSGVIANTSGALNRPPGQWDICFLQVGGASATNPVFFTVV